MAPTTVVLAVAVIVTGAGEPSTVEADVAGAVRATVGKVGAATIMAMGTALMVVPLESVTRALMFGPPTTEGVQTML